MSQVTEVPASSSTSTVQLDLNKTQSLPSPAETAVMPSLTSYPFPALSGISKPRSAFSQFRRFIRQPLAEFVGVAIFVFFGTGVDCQVVLSTNKGVASAPKGDFLSVNFGWAIGLAMGAWISGGISGGHLNPAVTLAMAIWRGFSWRKVPGYIFSQVLGGLVGAGLVYGNYRQAIEIFEAGQKTRASAGLFATYALDYMSTATCFFTEFLGTAILVFVVMAITDKKNNGTPPAGLLPVALFLMLLGLGVAFGMQTSYAFNPARDFGPRLLLTFAGYGKQLYNYRSQYWLWCPIIAPFLGAQAAAAFYELFLSGERAEDDDKQASQTEIEVVNVKSATFSPDERV